MVHELNEKFTEIYENTYNDVLRYIVSKCRSVDDIPDLIQNTYLNFYNRIKKQGDIKEPKKYLITIAKHEVYKLYGFLSFTKNFIPVYSKIYDEDFSNFEPQIFSEEISDNMLQCNELWNYLKRCDLLTFKIFVLYFSQELKIVDISKLLNVNESTVKNKLYRTIKQMREEFNTREVV